MDPQEFLTPCESRAQSAVALVLVTPGRTQEVQPVLEWVSQVLERVSQVACDSARWNTKVAECVVPVTCDEPSGVVTFNSSPTMLNVRTRSVPTMFGTDEAST